MFDFQRELSKEPIKAYYIDLVCTTNYPFEEPADFFYAESYSIGESLRITEGGTKLEAIDKYFKIRVELELKDYISKAESLLDLNNRIRKITREKSWYSIDEKSIEIAQMVTPEFLRIEFGIEVPREYNKDFRVLNEKDALESFNNRILETKDSIGTKINNYFDQIIYDLLSDDFLKNLEENLLSTARTEVKHKSVRKEDKNIQSLSLTIKPVNLVDYLDDLWDVLFQREVFKSDVSKARFKALFGKGVSSDNKLEWQDSISSLALFLKNLPLDNENVPLAGASIFTCKGQPITNAQLSNNGRSPKSQKEKALVHSLKELSATYS